MEAGRDCSDAEGITGGKGLKMGEVKWIKLATGLPDNKKIKQLRTLPEGDTIALMWVFLMCLAGETNDDGMVYFTKEVPYTDEMLSKEFNMDLNTVRLGLMTFQKYGMIEVIEDIICLPSWERWQNTDGLDKIREQTRKRVAKHRERQRLSVGSVTGNVTVTQSNATEEDIERDIEREKEYISESDEPIPASAPAKKKKVKHKHGEYLHVLLTDDEFGKLITEYGNTLTDKLIKFLDEYIEMKGYKAKNHYLCIRKWVVDAVKERDGKKGNTGTYGDQTDLDDLF